MRWTVIVFTACLPLLAIQAAHTQQPTCEVACRVNPFTAPASCNCGATGGEVQAPTPPPAPVRPGVPDCEVACRTNPYTAPPTCDCTLIGRGGGGGGGGDTGPGPSSSGIVDDGVLGIGELLDYMEALYRQRIAGVQRYYFLERAIVGQSPQAARAAGRYSIALASTARAAPAGQGSLPGVNTGVPVLRTYEKVQKDGQPAMKLLTQREKNQRTVKDPEIMARASAEERAAFEALAKDPSLLLGALGQVADVFGAGGDALRVEAEKMAGAFEQDEREAAEDAFRDDVLLELMKLKKAFEVESGSGGQLHPGSYDPDTRTFRRGPRCGSNEGCTAQEIARFFGPVYMNAVDARDDAELAGQPFYSIRLVPCVFWRPSADAVVTVGTGQGNATAEVVAAEFWLAIPRWITMELFSHSPDAVPDWVDWELELDELDRPLRMTIIVGGPDGLRRFDRIYDHFRPVPTGSGPALNEPRTIREQMGPCASVGTQADGSPMDCKGVATMVVDRLRSKFTVNQNFPSMVEEARMIEETLGCIGTPSSDPDSPCYEP